MPFDVKTFTTRTISAVLFGAVMLAGFLLNTWAFLALMLVIAFIGLREFQLLMRRLDADMGLPERSVLPLCLTGCACLAAVFARLSGYPAALALIMFAPASLLLTALGKRYSLQAVIGFVGGLAYIVLPLTLMLAMRFHSIILPLALMLMIWINDTMAYIVGSLIGRTPFSPISPKKTWEGTAGGALLTVASAALYGYFSDYYPMQDWIALSVCAAVAGTAGDLLESRIKRLAGVKDSGTLMPGHGGVLDRFDSMLIAAPFAYAYVYAFMSPLALVIF